MHGIFLGVIFGSCCCHAIVGLLGVMLAVDEYHVAFGLLVARIIFIMMLVDIMF